MVESLKIKVCGMKFTENRKAVEKLPVDLLGYIFYPPSKRYVGENPDTGLFGSGKPKAGVFVDENVFEMLALAKNLNFDYVQLHGKENPKTCKIIRAQGLKVIKAFNLNEAFDFTLLKTYEKTVDYFLFDTKTNLPGGSGKKFDWSILEKYEGEIPFFLSGGIQPDDAEKIRGLDHRQLFGIDLNSGFEDEPGVKNIEKLENFIKEIKAL